MVFGDNKGGVDGVVVVVVVVVDTVHQSVRFVRIMR